VARRIDIDVVHVPVGRAVPTGGCGGCILEGGGRAARALPTGALVRVRVRVRFRVRVRVRVGVRFRAGAVRAAMCDASALRVVVAARRALRHLVRVRVRVRNRLGLSQG